MTFRRSQDAAHRTRDWRNFTASQRDLFESAGLPGVMSEDQDAFEDFLMHGFLAMPGGLSDGTRFSTDELDATQRDWLDELAALYIERFGGPGVSLGPRRDQA